MAGQGSWTGRERAFVLAAFTAGLGWNLFVLLNSPGWSLDDELSHYLRSRSVWENPALIFDSWTRIGRNVFHFLPAHFGLTAARVWTLAFAALSVLITTSLAAKLGARRAWLVPLALVGLFILRGVPWPHSFRQWSGVRREGRSEVDHGGRGQDRLHHAGIALGERLYRKLQRPPEG